MTRECRLVIGIAGGSARGGGGVTILRHQVSELAAAEDVELVIVTNSEAADAFLHVPRTTVIVPRWLSKVPSALRVVGEQASLGRIWRRHGVAVIYQPGGSINVFERLPQVVAFQSGNPFVKVPVKSFSSRLRHTALRLMAGVAIRRAAALVAVSHALADVMPLPRHRAPEIHVIPPGLSTDLSAPIRRSGPDPRPFVYVGSDAAHKDLATLVAAFGRYVDRGGRRSLVLVGTDRSALRRTTRGAFGALDSPAYARIEVAGYLSRAELANRLEASAAYVSLSRLESVGLGAMEAASFGLPSVLSDISAHREFNSTDGTRFVPVGAVGAAAQALLEFDDDALVGRLGQEAQSFVGRWTWERHCRDLRALFDWCVG